jgi:hypothetical protein
LNTEPNSQLTSERPDIWIRAVALATSVTGLEYVHKAPLPDGTIYACGGSFYYPPDPPTPHEIKIRKIDNLDRQIQQNNENYWRRPEATENEYDSYIRNIEDLKKKREEARVRKIPTPELDKTIADYEIGLPEAKRKNKESIKGRIDKLNEELEQLKRERGGITLAPIPVPDGAMEWLLHEVGHWVASTAAERQLPNYGYGIVKRKGWGSNREWQAWAFEEIIMAPFGPSRGFAPVEHRGGTAFDGPGWQPIPEQHLRHTAVQIRESGVEIEQWRSLYGEWVQWGKHRDIYASLNH